jgi:chloramphenicol-sensitive protein RarD
MNASTHERNGGLLYGFSAYAIWGVLPLYFSLITPFAKPLELLAHRLLWGLLFLSLALTASGRRGTALATLRDRRTRWLLVVSALLVATNWFVFLFGVSSGRVVETSLGYFLTPLVSIVLGLLVFRERLRSAAKVGLALSVAGIVYLVAALGTLPWMALTIAFSFGRYGMVRKIARVDGLVGLFVETLILAPAAAVYLLVQASSGGGAVVLGSVRVIALLVLSGTLTAVPMICYGEATRRLKLSTLGFLQYLLPTLQLLQAVTMLGEPFRPELQVCFALIWTALAMVAVDSVLFQSSPRSDPGVCLRTRHAAAACTPNAPHRKKIERSGTLARPTEDTQARTNEGGRWSALPPTTFLPGWR